MYMKQNPNSEAVVTVCTVNSCLFGHPTIMDTQILQTAAKCQKKIYASVTSSCTYPHPPPPTPFCIARGSGICQPQGQPQTCDTHAVSCQNINTEDFTRKTSRLAHL